MTCWSVTAVNERARCKTRLAGMLHPAQRSCLVAGMLHHVVSVLRATLEIDRVAVISPENWDLPPDVAVMHDRGVGLNAALTEAAARAVREGADRLVIIHADLPLLHCADVTALIQAVEHGGIALATDEKGEGTNALCVRLPTRLEFAFGPRSLHAHLAGAARNALVPTVLRRPGLAFDMDEMHDYRRWSSGRHGYDEPREEQELRA